MTLKGKKNHYNVKLLRGYGASISLKDKKVCLKGGRDDSKKLPPSSKPSVVEGWTRWG